MPAFLPISNYGSIASVCELFSPDLCVSVLIPLSPKEPGFLPSLLRSASPHQHILDCFSVWSLPQALPRNTVTRQEFFSHD